MKYDFSGWATRNDLRCADGRTIRKDAFKDNDGQTVPLVWMHQHNDPNNVLGHALLENRPEGVYSYCTFNDTDSGRNAKELVLHKDVVGLSIYANQLKQKGGDVLHGAIREVSLVLAGANPGAYIDAVLAHGEDSEEEAVIYTGEEILLHSADSEKAESENADTKEKETKEVADKNEKTVKDVFDELTDEQKDVVYFIIGEALKGENADEEEDSRDVKHNVFENDAPETEYLAHSDEEDILKLAKSSQVGSFQTALQIFAEENSLQHDALAGGFAQPANGQTGDVTYLFPEYKDVRPGAPELITSDQGWIGVVLRKVHKSPISRIRTRQVDIRNIETLRAKGYVKGKQKSLAGNFRLAQRTTDPQTIYVKNALHRDDIVDITDFDYVQYLYNIDRMMLNEELATAIMIGDGRDVADADKIQEEHIRPIWTDDELYTMHVDLEPAAELQGSETDDHFGANYMTAEAFINTMLYARERFKGSGQPDLFITPHMLNVMLLARDLNGRRIYSSKAELASSLNVGEIYTVEQFENKTRVEGEGNAAKTKKLLGLVVNLADYSLGSTKGGEITHFTQFDIDFNQQKSLIETRVSGALTRVYSAIAIEEDYVAPASNSNNPG